MVQKRRKGFEQLQHLLQSNPSEVIETLLDVAKESPEKCEQILNLLSPLLAKQKDSQVVNNNLAKVQFSAPSLSMSSEGIRPKGLRRKRFSRSPRSKDEMSLSRESISLKGKFREVSKVADSPQIQFFKCKKTAEIEDILKEPQLASGFREYLVKKYCEENYDFWKEANRFQETFATLKPDDALRYSISIYKTYIQTNSAKEINISSALRKELDEFFKQTPEISALHAKIFYRAHCEITKLLAFEWFPSFKEDEAFIGW